MLRNYDLLVIVEHVKNNSPSLRVYLQKTSIKKEVEQVEEQKLGSKVDLQKVKVKHVEKQKLGSKVDLQKVKVKHVKKGGDRHYTYKLKL
jgi:3-isopropylmalate dehydratase small subunit